VFLDPQGRRGEMQAGLLPAPFHMTGAFAKFAPLALIDKLSIAWAMLNILQTKGRTWDVDKFGGISMLEWLRRRHQTKGAIERFWRVVLVSALDEELDKTDARYGIDVFWKAFLSNRTGYRMGVPVVPLAELYDGCKSAIEQKGGEINVRATARQLQMENGAVTAVQFDAGLEERADAFILAVPHTAVASLVPEDAQRKDSVFRNLAMLKTAPITGIHLWFDREVMTDPFVTLLDTTTQWIFNKTALYSPLNGAGKNSGKGQYLQLVVSASYNLLQKPRQEIIDLCLKEVRQALPAARDANLIKATVIKEAAATFSPEPGVDRWRPTQETSVQNLFLAGDWTDTGWPATMEGAVRSGYLAAEAVLRREGRPHQFVRPDLGADGLVALWSRN
jgi:zeta-carotene desaturase